MLIRKISSRGTPLALMPRPIASWLQYIQAPWMARPPFRSQSSTAASVTLVEPGGVKPNTEPSPITGMFTGFAPAGTLSGTVGTVGAARAAGAAAAASSRAHADTIGRSGARKPPKHGAAVERRDRDC